MKRNKSMIWAFTIPGTILFLGVFIYPIIRTVIMSFFKIVEITDPISKWEFRGLGNYADLFNARQAEDDVHARAAALLRVPAVEAVRAVDGVVEEGGLLCIRLAHGGKAAVLLDPADGFADHVDGEDGRGVVE